MLNVKQLIQNIYTKTLKTEFGEIDDTIISIQYNEKESIYTTKPLLLLIKYLEPKNIKTDSTHIFKLVSSAFNIPPSVCNVILKDIPVHILQFKLSYQFIIDLMKIPINSIIINDLINHNEIIPNFQKKEILVDFSSPNIAKELHVGHLRSTIIGDSICKLFELLGHTVHRINHIGDYGTGFGMILEHLLQTHPNYYIPENPLTITDLQDLYVKAKERFDTDSEFKSKSKTRVVKLQTSDPETLEAYHFIKNISVNAYREIYKKLKINITDVGESFYQPFIPDILTELKQKNITTINSGRTFTIINHLTDKINDITEETLLDKKNKTDATLLTLQKSDGASTYDTTDLAALKYRLSILNVDEIYYVTDNGQFKHFKSIFKVAECAQWQNAKQPQQLKHVGFGLILNDSGQRIKSREGTTLKLNELLTKSINHAKNIYIELLNKKQGNKIDTTLAQEFVRIPSTMAPSTYQLTEIEKQTIDSIAYSSIKYADLSNTRIADYAFSYDKFISLKGNTGVYQMYMYVRICAILRKAKDYYKEAFSYKSEFNVTTPEEIELCTTILRFPEILSQLASDLMFHSLCKYLYTLSTQFSTFHSNNRCLEYDADNNLIKANYNRLLICHSTKKIMECCFNILGMDLIEKM